MIHKRLITQDFSTEIMRPSDNELDQKVNDLRDRMRLLQKDRRANVDLMEANRASISSEIRTLRDENKTLRLRLTQLQKRLSTDRDCQNELANSHKESLQLRTEFDSLKVSSIKYNEQLQQLKDEAKLCDLETKKLDGDWGPLSKKIKRIENKLDNVLLKYNEAISIKSTYEHIVRRLNDEKLSFNNQLIAIERTINLKNGEYEELINLSADANRALEIAQSELQQARKSYEDKRSKRMIDLKEREQIVKIRKQMLEKQERREAKRKDAIDQQKSKLTRDANEILYNSEYIFHDENEMFEQEKKLDMYDAAFKKLKDVTGVSNVDEILVKMNEQKKTKETLENLSKQNVRHIENLKKEISLSSINIEQNNISTESSTNQRKILDEAEDSHVSALSTFDRAKEKCERLSSILMRAKSGVKHLQNRVERIADLHSIELEDFDDTDPGTNLWSTGNILLELRARIKEEEMNRLHDLDSLDVDGRSDDSIRMTIPFNQRISLPSARNPYSDDENSLENKMDAEDEEWNREKVKKSSSYILRIEKRKLAKEAATRTGLKMN